MEGDHVSAIMEHWADTIPDDPRGAVRRLKDGSGGADIWLCGGGRLAAALRPEIDRLVLKVNPVVFGDGIALFDGDYTLSAYELVSTTHYDSGVPFNDYRALRASS